MNKRIGIGLLGLGTVGTGVMNIMRNAAGRHPLVHQLDLVRVAVRDLKRERNVEVSPLLLTSNPQDVVDDPAVEIVVEVMGGIEPARQLILRSIAAGKSVVTANKAVIARHGEEIAIAASKSGVYVLIEAAVGGGIPIIEPLKQSLGANRIDRVSGIINGTTNYILSRMTKEGVPYPKVLKEAQQLGFAEADPASDVEGLDAADKISILSRLAFGGLIDREAIPTRGISDLKALDIDYAKQLGYCVKLLAVSERFDKDTILEKSLSLGVRVQPTLIPIDHPLAGVNDVNNAILVEGDPIGEVMFYGPGAGSGPTASAVVADILNIAGISQVAARRGSVDPLLAAASWRKCHLVDPKKIVQRNYVRLRAVDTPGVIGSIGTCFGKEGVSIQSIVQFDVSEGNAEIVVITHAVSHGQMTDALIAIQALPEVKGISAHLGCL
ncbi:homoserine dehydrogenase [Prochlorococcus sp. MIT 1341]|uniref:homoserine dehydrogenase n=1 Tax=Prochlorococcus sp. MIT 1341 TaxID=3096221 RepID=UPI002A749D0C|nr:homoserine dehydrogenase [Prochlorococcus sp. MIT 1341]